MNQTLTPEEIKTLIDAGYAGGWTLTSFQKGRTFPRYYELEKNGVETCINHFSCNETVVAAFVADCIDGINRELSNDANPNIFIQYAHSITYKHSTLYYHNFSSPVEARIAMLKRFLQEVGNG